MANWVKLDRGCGHKEEVKLSVGWYRAQDEKKAFFSSACPICGFVKAAEVKQTVAQTAPNAPAQTVVAPTQTSSVKINRYPGRCHCCGAYVPAGKGQAIHLDYEQTWVVQCIDKTACEAELARKHEILAQQAKAYYVD